MKLYLVNPKFEPTIWSFEGLRPFTGTRFSTAPLGLVTIAALTPKQWDIEIADVATRSYAAAHTGSPMFAVQMAINVPATVHVAQFREEFLEICDRLNLDAILEPVKA